MVHLSAVRAMIRALMLAALSCPVSACRPARIYSIAGRVSGSWQCVNAGSSRMPTIIKLQPLDWTASFSFAEPQFSFSNVRPGDYTLEVTCTALNNTLGAMPVSVTAADLVVDVVLPFPDLPRDQPSASLAGHRSEVLSLTFSQDGSTLISAAEDGTLIRWDLSTRQSQETLFHGHTDATLPLALSQDGTLVASGVRDGTIRLWDGLDEKQRHTLVGLDDRPQGIAISPGGDRVVAWADGESGRAVLWSVADGALIFSIDLSPDHPLSWWTRKAILFEPGGGDLISVVPLDREWLVQWRDGNTGAVEESDLPSGVEMLTLSTPRSASSSPDGTRFAFGAAGIENRGSLVIWEPATGRSVSGSFPLGINRVAFSPDGSAVASTAYDNTVVLWDAATAEATRVLVTDSRGVAPFAWSPDGSMLAAADGDGHILLWELP